MSRKQPYHRIDLLSYYFMLLLYNIATLYTISNINLLKGLI